MNTKIQFQKNAAVLASNGEQVGSLNRVVLDPNTKVLSGIVIRTGTLLNHEERVVPIEWVAETTTDQILLRKDAGDVASFAPFEEEHIVEEDNVNRSSTQGVNIQPMIYGTPVYGTPLQTTTGEEFATRIDQNIPEGTVAMKEGAKVMSADGEHVGDVERVFTGIPNEQITHLLISQGKIKKTTKLVPIDWVNTMTEDEVNLRVNKVSIDNLAETSVR
jgi:uncharacterized protein YrrD